MEIKISDQLLWFGNKLGLLSCEFGRESALFQSLTIEHELVAKSALAGVAALFGSCWNG